jgi:hypothetical protein
MTSKTMDCKTLKDQLLSVTLENTKLMKELAALKSHQMTIGAKINDATFSNELKKTKSSNTELALEKAKLLEQSSRKQKEILQLKAEIHSLSAKCGSIQF